MRRMSALSAGRAVPSGPAPNTPTPRGHASDTPPPAQRRRHGNRIAGAERCLFSARCQETRPGGGPAHLPGWGGEGGQARHWSQGDTESHKTQGIFQCLPGLVLVPRPSSVAMATAKLLLSRLATLRAEGNAFTPDRAASCEFLRPSISQAGPRRASSQAVRSAPAPPASALAPRRGSRPRVSTVRPSSVVPAPGCRPPPSAPPECSASPRSAILALASPSPSLGLRLCLQPLLGPCTQVPARCQGPNCLVPPRAGAAPPALASRPAGPYFGSWRCGPGSPARKESYSGLGRPSSCDPRASRQALHGGAASRRPGAQPWLCPPPRAAPAAAARPLRARERVSSKLEPASAAVPDSSARCGPAQMPGPPPRLRQRSMLASSAPAPAQACQAAGSCMVRDH
ncbi:hypothetical protein NN561_000050 [Cricetulus griseus]